MHAIETKYKGYRFRSRLEARWAVFFDTLGFRWEYEKEGFDINGTWYLPDFWLEDIQCCAEVKPGQFDQRAYQLASACKCILLEGMPDVRWYVSTDDCENTPQAYKEYCEITQENWLIGVHIHLPYSLYKKKLWFYYGEDIGIYDNTGFLKAVFAARSARFEHGAHGA